MRNYLSFGGGVNSVAMMLLLIDEGVEFEAVYVWMPNWPETHEYLMMLESKGYPITVIFSSVTLKGNKCGNLYEYAKELKMVPRRYPRWCTYKFKVSPLHDYYKKPCFSLLGIAADEAHRAKMSSKDGVENRFPLIERNITRNDCIEIIKSKNLPIPMRSGCFICPYQRKSQLKQLRRHHPDLFCKFAELEDNNLKQLKKGPFYNFGKPIRDVINEKNAFLFEELDYPPCQCGL